MLNHYPAWKYLLLIIILVVGSLYALPNLYGEDPSLQVSAERGYEVSIDTQETVRDTLKTNSIPYSSIVMENDKIMVRFDQIEDQLKAKDLVTDKLDRGYIVTLNLAPNTQEG